MDFAVLLVHVDKEQSPLKLALHCRETFRLSSAGDILSVHGLQCLSSKFLCLMCDQYQRSCCHLRKHGPHGIPFVLCVCVRVSVLGKSADAGVPYNEIPAEGAVGEGTFVNHRRLGSAVFIELFYNQSAH